MSGESTPPDRGRPDGTPASTRLVEVVLGRELRTLARNRTLAVLVAAFTMVALGIGWVGDGIADGYVPTVVDLLTPMELLVPVLAVAFGYRAIVDDDRRGELDVLETYPLTAREHVLGVYGGRAIGLLVALAIPLALVGVAVAVFGEEPLPLYATHAGADSPVLYLRFVVLTALFGLAVLAIALAISALASGLRSALALAIVALIVLLVGIDLAVVYGFASGVVADGSLVYAIALSPLSAFRGLVFETVVVTAAGTGPQSASPIASVLSLVAWTVGSLLVAILAVRR